MRPVNIQLLGAELAEPHGRGLNALAPQEEPPADVEVLRESLVRAQVPIQQPQRRKKSQRQQGRRAPMYTERLHQSPRGLGTQRAASGDDERRATTQASDLLQGGGQAADEGVAAQGARDRQRRPPFVARAHAELPRRRQALGAAEAAVTLGDALTGVVPPQAEHRDVRQQRPYPEGVADFDGDIGNDREGWRRDDMDMTTGKLQLLA
mmetsp:Transcript_132820/g.424954  ORF Transcript_132820/g.424954 Transcript_132820/m.424954 type:complete len:208 (-) Transcript_132820:1212-1835(-)